MFHGREPRVLEVLHPGKPIAHLKKTKARISFETLTKLTDRVIEAVSIGNEYFQVE